MSFFEQSPRPLSAICNGRSPIIKSRSVFLGTAGCKIGIHAINVFMLTSIFTLAYISIDRYLCVCHPKIGYARRLHPGWVIAAIWIFSILFLSPFSIFCGKSKDPGKNSCDCYSRWPRREQYTVYQFSVVIVGFYIPFITMLISYLQICIRLWGRKGERSSIENDQSGKKKRSIKMMILATSLFFISWFPYTVLYLVKLLQAGDPSIVG